LAKELTHRADELKTLGWSTDEVARYAELWDYRQRWGAMNLEREDRLFLRKAEAALPAIVSGKAAAKKAINEKSYYRWICFHLKAMDAAEAGYALPQGSRGAWPILLEEERRLLDYYQPVLGLPDTIKAKAFDAIREEFAAQAGPLAAADGQTKNYDFMCAMTSGLFYARCCLFNVATAYASDPTAVDHLGLGLQVTNRLSPTQVASACSKSALMSSMCSKPTDTRTMVGVTPAEACSSALSC
jgi:hypothetical protein